LNFCFCFVHTQTEIGVPGVATLSFLSQRVNLQPPTILSRSGCETMLGANQACHLYGGQRAATPLDSAGYTLAMSRGRKGWSEPGRSFVSPGLFVVQVRSCQVSMFPVFQWISTPAKLLCVSKLIVACRLFHRAVNTLKIGNVRATLGGTF
jgi:hypothetical protein